MITESNQVPQVLVFGDIGVDVYYVGSPRGLSAEAPVPVLTQTEVLALPGMAGNVAVALGNLGVQATLVQPTNPHYPIKNRVITQDGHQLARWDVDDWCSGYTPEDFASALGACPSPSAIIVSDYGKGAITKYAQDKLISLAATGIPVYVDTKGDPMGWLGENITLFPNSQEYKRWESNYRWLPSVVYKRGAQGVAYLRYGSPVYSLDAWAMVVNNVCGAGDIVIAAWAASQVQGLSMETSLAYANEAASALVEQPFQDRQVTLEDILVRQQYRSGGDVQYDNSSDNTGQGCGCNRTSPVDMEPGFPGSQGYTGSTSGSPSPDKTL